MVVLTNTPKPTGKDATPTKGMPMMTSLKTRTYLLTPSKPGARRLALLLLSLHCRCCCCYYYCGRMTRAKKYAAKRLDDDGLPKCLLSCCMRKYWPKMIIFICNVNKMMRRIIICWPKINMNNTAAVEGNKL